MKSLLALVEANVLEVRNDNTPFRWNPAFTGSLESRGAPSNQKPKS